MKLLLVGTRVDRVERVVNFSGVWSHYLEQEFRKRGIGLRYEPQLKRPDIVQHYRAIDLADINHVLALGLAYFDRVQKECVDSLKARCRGLVTQIHDRQSLKAVVDLTFGIRAHEKAARYHCIGWAADSDLCRPCQSPDHLQILVDHPDYGARKTDRSLEMMRSALAFAKSASGGKPVVIRAIRDNGVADCVRAELWQYHRKHIPYLEMCREYSRSDIFLVTHPESIGLSALECAMAGALVVTPKSFIADDLLSTIRHVSYDGAIPWDKVMAALNIDESRKVAMANSWGRVADRILERLC